MASDGRRGGPYRPRGLNGGDRIEFCTPMNGGAAMRYRALIRFAPLLIVVAFASDACRRQPQVAGVQVDTGAQPRMQPLTVEGCLKSGALADNTFVVLGRAWEADAVPDSQPSTYALVGGDAAEL